MPELRRDPITHRWSIIATERAGRPKALQRYKRPPAEVKVCPFCAGKEHLTPPSIREVPSPDGRGWQIRVIPNKYPALRIEGDLDKRPEGIFDHMNGVGAHEVVIESPVHDFKLQGLPREHVVAALEVYRDRMSDLQGDQRFKFSLLFRNRGREAGATIPHGHAQIIALPVVPHQVQELLDGARRYYEFRGRNVFDDIVRQEVADGRRLIYDNDSYVLLAPYASRFPFEMNIIPRAPANRFEETRRSELEPLAEVLTLALDRLDRALGGPAYNFIIQSAPYGHDNVPWYRWQIVLMPTLTRVAGFEWGTGFYINPVAPEQAAEVLRNVPT